MEEKAAQSESKMMAAEKQEQDSSGAGEESVSKGVFIQEGRSRRAGQLQIVLIARRRGLQRQMNSSVSLCVNRRRQWRRALLLRAIVVFCWATTISGVD